MSEPHGKDIPPVYRETIPIASYDVGYDRKLTLSALLRWQQEIGEHHFLCGGLGFTELSDRGMAFVVLQATARIFRRPHYGEKVVMETWYRPSVHSRFVRCYRLRDTEDRNLIESVSTFALVDIQTHRPLRPQVFDAFGLPAASERPHGCPYPERLRLPEDMPYAGEFTVRRSHLDYLQHFNNTRYADLLIDFSPADPKDIKGFTVVFKHESRLGDCLSLYTEARERTVFMRGTNADRLAFEAEMML